MVTVRVATEPDRVAVRRLVDGAALSLAEVSLPTRLVAGDVLLATQRKHPQGTLVATRDPQETHIVAVAVRRRRRGHGIGSALVEEAATRWAPLRATCAAAVVAFWRANGFQLTGVDGDRHTLRRDA